MCDENNIIFFRLIRSIDIKKRCHKFFTEVVSTLCFGRYSQPEPELVAELIGIVFDEGSKEFGYSESDESDSDMQSLLLHLLLEYKLVNLKCFWLQYKK